MKIGWENVRGGYYIKKLFSEIETQTEALEDDIEAVADDVGDISDLNTTAKTNLVSAINEVDSGISVSSTEVGEVTTQAQQTLTNTVRKFGRVVVINFTVYFKTNSSASAEHQIGLVPEGYRPQELTYCPVGYFGTTSDAYAYIQTDGKIKVPKSIVNSHGIAGINATYIV